MIIIVILCLLIVSGMAYFRKKFKEDNTTETLMTKLALYQQCTPLSERNKEIDIELERVIQKNNKPKEIPGKFTNEGNGERISRVNNVQIVDVINGPNVAESPRGSEKGNDSYH